MATLMGRHKQAILRLQAKYEGDPKPINSPVSIGGGQMTINIGMESASQLDLRKSNNAAMEMVIAIFFIVGIYLTGLPSPAFFNK